MDKYMLLFHNNDAKLAKLSPSEMQALGQKWWAWKQNLESKGALISVGERLAPAPQAKVLRGSKMVLSDGPYVEAKDAISGYAFLQAESYAEAVELSKGCPVFENDGSVEIRPIAP